MNRLCAVFDTFALSLTNGNGNRFDEVLNAISFLISSAVLHTFFDCVMPSHVVMSSKVECFCNNYIVVFVMHLHHAHIVSSFQPCDYSNY